MASAQTPLDSFHRENGAKMVPFAGWSMPLHYGLGVLDEHRYCRRSACLFDVSHMLQVELRGGDAGKSIECMTPAAVESLKPGKARYGVITNERGGIVDDLIVTRIDSGFFVVANASRRVAPR